MAKQQNRTCDQCKTTEFTFSRAKICAACCTLNKQNKAIESERQQLTTWGYKIISGPRITKTGHRAWKLTAPCCGGEFEPVYGNILKQLNLLGKIPCRSCGGKERMSKAMAAYIETHGATYDLAKFEEYRKKVTRLTGRNYEAWKHLINPLDLKRGRHLGDWHLDHKVPVIWCFKNDVPPETAAAVQNLQMLSVNDNLKKSGKVLCEASANAILKESAAAKMIFEEIGEEFRNKIEVLSDTANVWIADNYAKTLVREAEYFLRPAAVISRLKYLTHQITKRQNTRELELRPVSVEIERKFLEQWHIQGYSKSKHAIGLWKNDELMSLMTFAVPRYKQGQAESELLRFCNHGEYIIPGGASKLFKKFVQENNHNAIVSYSLNRWGSGSVYLRLGFKKHSSNSSPRYLWRTDGKIRTWRASILMARRRGLSQVGGEIEGTLKIQDPGSSTWIWVNEVNPLI